MKKENQFQAELLKELREIFKDGYIVKIDTTQGIPDILILYQDKWATLECKRSKDEPHRPNQDYYVDKMNKASFSRFIFPENKEEVLYELCKTFGLSR